jgi:hypothetical protein
MSVSTNAAGAACCGNCRAELEIRCTGGCSAPDIVFKQNPIAKLRRVPMGKVRHFPTGRKFVPGVCTYRDCKEPIVPHVGAGRPTTKCAKHLEYSRRWTNNRASPRVERRGT